MDLLEIHLFEVMGKAVAEEKEITESRFKRWSRLKSDSGTEQRGQDTETTSVKIESEVEYVVPDPDAMPGGSAIRRGATVPAMPSLVRDKDDDSEFDIATGMVEAKIKEPELTPDEQEIVSQLPPIESLNKDSDFTQFLSEKVPEFIRKRALSVLWRSDPVLANLDGLNDYDENYRVIDTLISAASDTVYRVGKGHLKNEELKAETDPESESPDKLELSEKPEVSDKLETGSGHELEVDFEEAIPDGELPKDTELNTEICTDAPDDSNEISDIQDKEVLISSSIRKPKNPV